jgi:Amiloride-sensitive sodium channel
MDCNHCLETLRDVRIPPEDIFMQCKFETNNIGCMQAFKELLLSHIMCYNFNGFAPYRHNDVDNELKQWHVDQGYESSVTLESYPRRAKLPGIKFGLTVFLRLKKNDYDYTCSENRGFQVD